MTTVGIVPVQHLAQAKSRLIVRLSPAKRRRLVIYLLDTVLDALERSSMIDRIMVVTPDPEVIDLAGCHDAIGLRETGSGLNDAIGQARDAAIQLGAETVLVMLGDLPLVRPRDIDDLLSAAEGADVVLASDRHHRGTNALVLRPPGIAPAFGPDSFQAHLAAARAAGLRIKEIRSPEIAFDIDNAADLDELERLGVNWMDTSDRLTVKARDRGCDVPEAQHADRGSHRGSAVE